MYKGYFITGAILGALAVALGAFGAHGLSDSLSDGQAQTFYTSNRYHFYHVFAILLIGLLSLKYRNRFLWWAGLAFIVGTFLFSGSLYLLSTKHLIGIESWGFLGPLTPIGGLFFIGGWILTVIGILRISTD